MDTPNPSPSISASPAYYSPLTPLDFTFGPGFRLELGGLGFEDEGAQGEMDGLDLDLDLDFRLDVGGADTDVHSRRSKAGSGAKSSGIASVASLHNINPDPNPNTPPPLPSTHTPPLPSHQPQPQDRDDWTLGLNLAWSAGMLMGDERGDGRGRAGRTGARMPPPSLLLGIGTESHAADDSETETEMEMAFRALLADAIEGRFAARSVPPLPRLTRCSPSPEQASPHYAHEPLPRTSGEWLGRHGHGEDAADRRSVASTRTGTYHSARSSWGTGKGAAVL